LNLDGRNNEKFLAPLIQPISIGKLTLIQDCAAALKCSLSGKILKIIQKKKKKPRKSERALQFLSTNDCWLFNEISAESKLSSMVNYYCGAEIFLITR
jgi:hypothetical protein